MATNAAPLLTVAIVTGSLRGIGRATALHLASLGAKLVINYTSNSTAVNAVAAEINSSTPNSAVTIRADVSNPAQVKSLFDVAEQVYNSPVHILINSAGVLDSKYSTIVDLSVEEFDRIFSVNAQGAFLCCKEAANRIKRSGGGRIIVLTSSLVAALEDQLRTYTASKAPVEGGYDQDTRQGAQGDRDHCKLRGPIATEMFFQGKSEEMINKLVGSGKLRMWLRWSGFWPLTPADLVNGQIVRVNRGYV